MVTITVLVHPCDLRQNLDMLGHLIGEHLWLGTQKGQHRFEQTPSLRIFHNNLRRQHRCGVTDQNARGSSPPQRFRLDLRRSVPNAASVTDDARQSLVRVAEFDLVLGVQNHEPPRVAVADRSLS